jgi:hypothetical protein
MRFQQNLRTSKAAYEEFFKAATTYAKRQQGTAICAHERSNLIAFRGSSCKNTRLPSDAFMFSIGGIRQRLSCSFAENSSATVRRHK